MTDCSIGVNSVVFMPIMTTRLAEESGCSSVGGFDTLGSA